MTADKREADEVAAALKLAQTDRWSPPPDPLPRPSALIPDYSFYVPPAPAAPPSLLTYVSPQSTPRPKRRARMLGRGRKGKS
jgi:hypothetical protein